jgi:hypothetical protein
MDAVLVTIAALSLILTIAMGVILFTVLREERQRSDARVALLVAAAAAIDPPGPAAGLEPEPVDVPLRADAAVRDELFAPREERSPWTRRIAVAAVFAACVAIGGYVVLPHGSGAFAGREAATIGVPLELVTLGHTQDSDSLTITGLVHNPRTGVTLKQVAATAVLFGEGGSLLTTGRANLDFATLGPGGDSPFVIKVPVTGVVTRYRVGFRTADGAVISHVDRRGDNTSARHAATSGSTPWAR